MNLSRRQLIGGGLGLCALSSAPRLLPASELERFAPHWSSLVEHYRVPDWFRDAKLGLWAHWSAQCVPETGDWYARNMYLQGHPDYEHHVRTYGHPSVTGFMEIVASNEQLQFRRTRSGLTVRLPEGLAGSFAVALKVHGPGLV